MRQKIFLSILPDIVVPIKMPEYDSESAAYLELLNEAKRDEILLTNLV